MLRTRALRLLVRLAIVVPFSALPLACGPPRTHARSSAVTAPTLGTAQSFAVLAGSTVTNTGPTVVTGNLGVHPGSAVTGFPPGQVIGTIDAADAVALQAQNADTTAYNVLAAQPCNFNQTGKDLGGLTLVAGVYCFSSSAQLTGALTLDAQGDPNAVFIFQIASKLTTASNSSVLVTNGGGNCNVFWQVGSSATVGTGTHFVGSILALTSIALETGAELHGRALAQNGAVTLDDNVITVATCASSTDGGAGGGGTDGGGGSDDGGTGGTCCNGLVSCNGACVDTKTDSSNCGRCGNACAADEDCRSGQCTLCQESLCGNACVTLVSDPNNCGGCGNVCAPDQVCQGGVCRLICKP
jgi:hypothetical protein